MDANKEWNEYTNASKRIVGPSGFLTQLRWFDAATSGIKLKGISVNMDSFASISSYGPHGAIVHYSPTPETDAELLTDNLYLIDSGAQYLDGTTDITRTIALCKEPTEQMKKDFTRALKGTISIAKCKFPTGIRGCF